MKNLDRYPGGKNSDGVFQTIINEMPPHDTYIEAFLGSGAIIKRKLPAAANVGIEIDPHVCNIWRRQKRSYCSVIEADAIAWLDTYADSFNHQTLIYLDPPYLLETRRSSRHIYRHELTTSLDHSRLLAIVQRLKCLCIISGYRSKLYNDVLSEWRSVDFPGRSRRGATTETIWLNFDKAKMLHDHRFIGTDHRNRLDIKRQQQRWIKRLEQMPDQQRNAMLQKIAAKFPDQDGRNAATPYQMQRPNRENKAEQSQTLEKDHSRATAAPPPPTADLSPDSANNAESSDRSAKPPTRPQRHDRRSAVTKTESCKGPDAMRVDAKLTETPIPVAH